MYDVYSPFLKINKSSLLIFLDVFLFCPQLNIIWQTNEWNNFDVGTVKVRMLQNFSSSNPDMVLFASENSRNS
jgi:hypothetical protein